MIAISFDTSGLIAGLNALTESVEQCVGEKVQSVVYYIDKQLHARTPVHSGQAVRNMIWSMGSPATGALPAIETPADPGRTSGMGLGSEPRRGANAAAARQSLAELNFKDPFQVYYLANNSPDIGIIEDGSSGLPGKSRAPAGVFAITMAEVNVRLASGAPL